MIGKCLLGNEGMIHLAKAKWLFKSAENSVRCDGLYALVNFNLAKIKGIWVLAQISIWEVVYLIVSNAPLNSETSTFSHPNKSISRDITALLRMKKPMYW